MKRKTLETTVLVMGLLIIGIALFLMFFVERSSRNLFLSNITFALGFLIYIIYTMMSTNSLNHEIKGLNNHIASLKDSIKKKDQQLEERSRQIRELKEENENLLNHQNKLQEELAEEQSKSEQLNLELTKIRSSQPKQ